MRGLSWIGVALLLAAGAALALLFVGEERRAVPAAPAQEQARAPGARPATELRTPAERTAVLEARESLESVRQEPRAAARGRRDPTNVERPVEWEGWRACLEEPNGTYMRACLRRWLEGRVLEPEELAELVCSSAPPDGTDRYLIEEAAALWPPREAPQRIRTFHGLCNDPGGIWVDFVNEMLQRDPAWCEAFAEALDPPALFQGEGLVLLLVADALAGAGDRRMQALLEAAARGELPANAEQRAFALTNAWELRGGARERLAFLESVRSASSFPGRPAEVVALLDCALSPRSMHDDAQGALAFLRAVLSDPLLAPAAAAHVLELHRWDRLPRALSESERRSLVELAQSIRSDS